MNGTVNPVPSTTSPSKHRLHPPRPKKPKPENPILVAVRKWTASSQVAAKLQAFAVSPTALIDSAPKRWVAYEPMALLPSGSFASDSWRVILEDSVHKYAESDHDRGGDTWLAALWCNILDGLSAKSAQPLTHLAVNDGIPLNLPGDDHVADGAFSPRGDTSATDKKPQENILRSPSGLRILYGDFGPEAPLASQPRAGGDAGMVEEAISDSDFELAFWVSTKQNGIYQTWAPRWTMFSRGNVKEKARLLGFQKYSGARRLPHHETATTAATTAAVTATPLAVDLYAGIGYFVFSYAKLGLRVLCWEVNPWSVEGLRRGARRNGWKVKVIKGSQDLTRPTGDLVDDDDCIVVFVESNVEAVKRLRELRSSSKGENFSNVLHVNCGFLPTSEPSWKAAVDVIHDTRESWLHLHENVAENDISHRGKEVERMIQSHINEARASNDHDPKPRVALEHTELVKTFAPGVRHCVFDLYVGI